MRTISKLSEATVQAELYIALKDAGLCVALEERVPPLVADVALYYPETRIIYALIEVKRGPSWRRGMTVQAGKYNAAGYPWRYCRGLNDIPSCVQWALEV